MKNLICLALVSVSCIASTGCMMATEREALERKADEGIAMMRAAIEKGMSELSSHTAALAGSGALINPGYEIEVVAGFGPTFFGKTTIRVIGASATLTANTQMGGPNRNVEDSGTGESRLPPTEPVTSQPVSEPE